MESTISTGKAAKPLGVSVKTLQRWEREGRLIPVARSDSNRRLYTEAQLREFIGLRNAASGDDTEASAVAMAMEGVDDPEEQEVRVICVETGEVVWRSTEAEYE
ncbi:MAG: MerR family DNA-binding transcriptional regulator, partial [Betaproteobacteria bacterium]|nr:MerR family DNA-binding transcriptional regulator [Betaproteobacteria bacterium]